MTNIKIKEIEFGAFGRCVEISNGKVEVVITLDMGPRVIRYGLTGKANMFCNKIDETYEKTGWKILGGHRIWMSPEHDVLTYEPDNEPIEYKQITGGVHIIGNLEKGTGLRKEMFVMLEEIGTNVAIKHCITNNNLWPVELAAWAMSVMAPGGMEVVPVNREDTGLLANGWLGIWPYSKMNDPRVWWGERYITLKSVVGYDGSFKFGITNPLGWAAYFYEGMAFVKKFQYSQGADYPDGGMNYETFTNDFMLEMESLSPLQKIEHKQSIVHLECWSLIDNIACPESDDDKIDELLAEFIPDCVNDSAHSCGCCKGEEHTHECGCGDDCGCDDDDCDCDDDGCGCGEEGCC
ncbi:MAG: hypothetical protein KAQ68_02015 [Clostridiales bacterium]|nr:hypothetical protein [Clostridiales bacterium]